MVIKMSKMAHFLYFLLTTAKNQSQFKQNVSGIWKILFRSFFKLGFTLCKTEQPLRGMELQQKEAQKD